MPSHRSAVSALAVALVLAPLTQACAEKRTPAPEIKTTTRVTFSIQPVGQANFQRTFLWGGLEKFEKVDPPGTPVAETYDERLKKACFAPITQQTSAGALLSFFIGPIVNLITDAAKSKLDEALEEYKAESKASEQAQFYDAGGKQLLRCFRVTRITTTTYPTGPAQRSLDFDFLGQVAIVGNGDGLTNVGDDFQNAYGVKIRPLRIFLAKPKARGSAIGSVGSVTFDGVWREGGVGKQGKLFTAPLFEEKFKRDPATQKWSKEPYYFPSVDKDGVKDFKEFPDLASLPLQPLVPISTTKGSTYVTVTASVTEVGEGDGKQALKIISKLFGKSQSDINDAVTKAAKKLVDPEAPTPPAKPTLFCGTITPSGTGSDIQWTQTDSATCPSK